MPPPPTMWRQALCFRVVWQAGRPSIVNQHLFRLARILHWEGAQKLSAEGARIEAPKGVRIREGCPPPQPTRGLDERRELSQRGPGLNAFFWHIWGPQNTSDRENSVTLLNNVQSPESDIFIWKWCIKLKFKPLSLCFKSTWEKCQSNKRHGLIGLFPLILATPLVYCGAGSESRLVTWTRCCHRMSDFKAKMHQNRFWLGFHPRPWCGSLQRSPRPLAGFRGPTSKGREKKGKEGQGGGPRLAVI